VRRAVTIRRQDVVVIGSGFAGSILAAALQKQGREVLLLERGSHPRFAIGESTTPLSNLLLEEIADEFDLPDLRALSKWGTWQKERPELAGGIKRGFTFYHHELGRAFPRRRGESLKRQLLVGASPNEWVADTHWYRPDLDACLVALAVRAGVAYRDRTDIEAVRENARGLRLSARRNGRRFEIAANFVVDASGPRGCLHRALKLPEGNAGGFPATQAVFGHFRGVKPLDAGFVPGEPPYPPEQAAVHHVFDGGWVWVLKFNQGVTSAGIVATREAARRIGLCEGEAGWRRALDALPALAETFAEAKPVAPLFSLNQVAFQSGRIRGRNWALLPSAAGVVDPLLSTGFPLTLLGVQRLARALGREKGAGLQRELARYARSTEQEFETTASLIRALYRAMGRFDDFKALTLLYFAAAGYSETARRLGKASLAPDFLLRGHPTFGPRLRSLCRARLTGRRLQAKVREAIAPIDVLGLSASPLASWYPASLDELYRNAGKMGATSAEVAAMVGRCLAPA
jgi:FADH2 O2-dependent halogenase